MSAVNLNVRFWDRLIAMGFLVILMTTLWPASWWFSVTRVYIQDAKQGQPVIMEVDRTIRRSFDATWDVLLRRQTASGWMVVCAAQGSADYNPDAVFPDPLLLDWWTNGTCGPSLTPGKYRLHTTWQLEPDFNPIKRVKITSNVFEVTS